MGNFKISNSQLQFLAYVFLAIAGIYFIGLRSVDIGSDTIIYFKYFDYVKYGDSFQGAERIEIGFYWLTKIISYFTDSKNVYLSIIFLIQFIGITSALNKKNKIFKPYLLVALVWLSFPFFYSITLNAIRQGLAFVFVIYAIDFKLQKRNVLSYVLLLLGLSFHYSTLIYIVCFFVSELKPKPKILITLWFSAIALSFFRITVKFIRPLLEFIFANTSLNTTHYSNYLDVCLNLNSFVGFRIDFIFFSSLPVIYYYFLKKYNSEDELGFQFIFILYLGLNIIYLLFADFPYSDRIAIASWLLMPLMVNFDFFRKIKMLGFFTVVVCCSSVIAFTHYLHNAGFNCQGFAEYIENIGSNHYFLTREDKADAY